MPLDGGSRFEAIAQKRLQVSTEQLQEKHKANARAAQQRAALERTHAKTVAQKGVAAFTDASKQGAPEGAPELMALKKLQERAHQQAERRKLQADEEYWSVIDRLVGRKWKSSGMLLQTTTGSILVAMRERHEELSCREHLFLFLNEPASGRFAYWFGRLMQLLLIASTLSATYETVGFVNQVTGPDIWIMLKLGFNAIFTVEAILRIISFIPIRVIHHSTLVWLDIITVLPVYLRTPSPSPPTPTPQSPRLSSPSPPAHLSPFPSLASHRPLPLSQVDDLRGLPLKAGRRHHDTRH